MTNKLKRELPPIPEKLYFSIGETSELCDIKPHVLRYWEQEFSQLNPSKRRGGRRYYQTKDIELIRRIRDLLYFEGFTIAGAKQQIQQQVHKLVEEVKEPEVAQTEPEPTVLQQEYIYMPEMDDKEQEERKVVFHKAIDGIILDLEELLVTIQ